MRAASSRATALATLVIVTMPSLLPACVQVTPEAKRCGRHMYRYPRIGCGSGASLEQALTSGCWHSGMFARDAFDRPGGSPVVSTRRRGRRRRWLRWVPLDSKKKLVEGRRGAHDLVPSSTRTVCRVQRTANVLLFGVVSVAGPGSVGRVRKRCGSVCGSKAPLFSLTSRSRH